MSNSSRESIFARVRAAQRPPMVRTPYPDYAEKDMITIPATADAWKTFVERMQGVKGIVFEQIEPLAAFLRGQGWLRGVCDPALRVAVGEKLGGGFTIDYAYEAARVDEYQFGITRAVGAIAETGTLVINDATTSARLAALAPWVHIAVLSLRDLWRDIPTALTRLGSDPNTVWITGPSKTGDIEGVLVQGVHGPGEQICLRLD
jgi:L-lactate dehydrogenase complex protein LldG